MLSQTHKIVLTVIITALVVGGGVYLWQKYSDAARSALERTIVKYNCEQSGGTYAKNTCACPSEFGADMYDRKTGYCQTTYGGPGGPIGVMMNLFVDSNRQ